MPADATVALDTFYALTPVVFDSSCGCRAPAGVLELTATCQDPSVCSTEVSPGSWSGRLEARVIGKRAGRSTVVVEYLHPGTNTRERQVMTLSFVAPTARPVLALGATAPPDARPIDHHLRPLAGGTLVPGGRCSVETTLRDSIVGGARPDVRLYACSEAITGPDGTPRFRACPDGMMCPSDRGHEYVLCATVGADGAIASTTILERALPFVLEARVSEGGGAAACAPKPTRTATR